MNEVSPDTVVVTAQSTPDKAWWAKIRLKNGKAGLEVRVKVQPELEEFIKSLGTGKINLCEDYGHKEWQPVDAQPLRVYDFHEEIDGVGNDFHMSLPGRDLIFDATPNLSFLRLVGIGAENGVAFTVRKPYSRQERERIKSAIFKGIKTIIQNYLAKDVYDMVLVPKKGAHELPF